MNCREHIGGWLSVSNTKVCAYKSQWQGTASHLSLCRPFWRVVRVPGAWQSKWLLQVCILGALLIAPWPAATSHCW